MAAKFEDLTARAGAQVKDRRHTTMQDEEFLRMVGATGGQREILGSRHRWTAMQRWREVYAAGL